MVSTMFGNIHVPLTINYNMLPIPRSPLLLIGRLGAYYNLLFVHRKLMSILLHSCDFVGLLYI